MNADDMKWKATRLLPETGKTGIHAREVEMGKICQCFAA
jgi:hypothetical protein